MRYYLFSIGIIAIWAIVWSLIGFSSKVSRDEEKRDQAMEDWGMGPGKGEK